jgi:hypothetical protein
MEEPDGGAHHEGGHRLSGAGIKVVPSPPAAGASVVDPHPASAPSGQAGSMAGM